MACMGQQHSHSIIILADNIIAQELIYPYGDSILFFQDFIQDKDQFSDPAAVKIHTILNKIIILVF